MTDLVSWLLAQIADDEASARATVPGPWRVSRDGLDVHADDLTVMENMDDPGPWHRALAAHIARHDPARVLAECAAKRRVLDLRDSWSREVERAPSQVRHIFEAQLSAADAIIEALAEPYADRPGFDPAWKVET